MVRHHRLNLVLRLSRVMAVPTLAVATLAATPAAPTGCVARSVDIPRGPAVLQRTESVPGTGGRESDLTLYSPALGGPTHVDVLVPAGYDPSGLTRYPVLYLLHGVGGSYASWTGNGVQAIVDRAGGAPFIVVMPDAGNFGFYSDWFGTDPTRDEPGPPPAWETYHVDELMPWIDASYPTTGARAVAGLSMGGFGAMSYAARHPGMFVAAGSFSGAVDTDLRYPYANDMLTSSSAVTGALPEHCIFGDPRRQALRWRASDPTYLAGNLRGTSLFIASGDGRIGPLDDRTRAGRYATQGIEEFVWPMNRAFDAALAQLGIPHTTDFYGPGTHSWPYWRRDLAHFLPQVQTAFRSSPAAPPVFTLRSAAPRFSAWGWTFTAHHAGDEFTYLESVSRAGLDVTGSGTLSVTTPPLYPPGAETTVTVGDRSRTVLADTSGRLSFDLDLGTAHSDEQTRFDAVTLAAWQHRSLRVVAPATQRLAAAGGASASDGATDSGSGPVLGAFAWVLAGVALAAVAGAGRQPRASSREAVA